MNHVAAFFQWDQGRRDWGGGISGNRPKAGGRSVLRRGIGQAMHPAPDPGNAEPVILMEAIPPLQPTYWKIKLLLVLRLRNDPKT